MKIVSHRAEVQREALRKWTKCSDQALDIRCVDFGVLILNVFQVGTTAYYFWMWFRVKRWQAKGGGREKERQQPKKKIWKNTTKSYWPFPWAWTLYSQVDSIIQRSLTDFTRLGRYTKTPPRSRPSHLYFSPFLKMEVFLTFTWSSSEWLSRSRRLEALRNMYTVRWRLFSSNLHATKERLCGGGVWGRKKGLQLNTFQHLIHRTIHFPTYSSMGYERQRQE